MGDDEAGPKSEAGHPDNEAEVDMRRKDIPRGMGEEAPESRALGGGADPSARTSSTEGDAEEDEGSAVTASRWSFLDPEDPPEEDGAAAAKGKRGEGGKRSRNSSSTGQLDPVTGSLHHACNAILL